MNIRERLEQLRRTAQDTKQYNMTKQDAYMEMLSIYKDKRNKCVPKKTARYEAVQVVAGMTGRTNSEFGKWLKRRRPVPAQSQQLTFF